MEIGRLPAGGEGDQEIPRGDLDPVRSGLPRAEQGLVEGSGSRIVNGDGQRLRRRILDPEPGLAGDADEEPSPLGGRELSRADGHRPVIGSFRMEALEPGRRGDRAAGAGLHAFLAEIELKADLHGCLDPLAPVIHEPESRLLGPDRSGGSEEQQHRQETAPHAVLLS
jgi:hypothetical protein